MKILKDKFEHFEPELAQDIWADIEKQLKKEEKKGILLAWNWKPMLGMAAAVTLLATSVIVWKILPSDTQSPAITQHQPTTQNPTLSAQADSSQVLEPNTTVENANETENHTTEAELTAKPVASQPENKNVQKTGKTKKVVKTYLVQVTETVEEVKSSNSNPNTTAYQPIRKEVEYKEVKIEQKQEETPNNKPVLVETPPSKTENNPIKAATKTRKPMEWTVYEVPQKPSNKSTAKTVANTNNADELDLEHFSWDKALLFAAKKLSKTENRPLEVEHKKDVWRYLFKFKDLQVEHKTHKTSTTEREL